MPKERILLKLSGESLKSKDGKSIFFHESLQNIARQISLLSKKYSISIVIGGGNIWRGRANNCPFLCDHNAHTVGMVATVINALVLQDYLRAENVSSTIFSSFPVHKIASDVSTEKVEKALDSGDVVIFSAGTGVPYLSTDTCAAVRALEVGAKKIFMGKNGVKGIYDFDPKENKEAVFFEKISYEEVIDRKLGFMDLSATIILKSNGRPKLIVFNQDIEDCFVKAVEGFIECSEVY